MTVDQLGRAYAAYRRTAGSRSIGALLIANAIPLIGVLFFGWSLLTILVIYWLENGIVGFWNVLKIILARGSAVPTTAATGSAASSVRAFGSSAASRVGNVALAAFFVFHYGLFWFVHGVFVFSLPLFLGGSTAECIDGQSFFPPGTPGGFPGVDACAPGPFGEVLWTNVAIAGVALFLSHGASFLFNYIGRAEYLTASPTGQMGAAYGRVVVLHLTILFGAFAVAILGSPVAALLILVVLKTALDIALHRRERRSADGRTPADTEFGKLVREG